MSALFEELSAERKLLQQQGKLPEWFTTLGWQAFKGKYLNDCNTFEEQIDRIVENVAKSAPSTPDKFSPTYLKKRWKELFMNNHAYLATPPLSNNGTNRGLSVSCSGSEIQDAIREFYSSMREGAVLTQEGFGTSSSLEMIRPRGTPISRGGVANGPLNVFQDMVTMSQNVSQGGVRRGAWAGYIGLTNPAFDEIATEVKNNPDGSNVGWNVYDKDVEALNRGDRDAIANFQESQWLKCVTGKGYYYFPDKVARLQPPMYAQHGLRSKASNLCTEITLHADEEHSYTCVLSGMVATTFDEWKGTDAVQCMTIFLDCLLEDFLKDAHNIPGLEKIVKGTEKGRAIGLGITGYHSLLQERRLTWGSLEAHMLNQELFRHLHDESLVASQWMARAYGEPEWCKGYGVRNTHRTALAPNVSSALIFGSKSQGITPWYGNVFNEGSASGGMFRVNPVFIDILTEHGEYNMANLEQCLGDNGSARSFDFLTDHEKQVLLTAFEIDQIAIVNASSRRQRFICQGQSMNVFFDADEDERYISYVHQYIFEDPNIKSAYYLRSKAGVDASKGGCESCAS